jgi:hypothetical protein
MRTTMRSMENVIQHRDYITLHVVVIWCYKTGLIEPPKISPKAVNAAAATG